MMCCLGVELRGTGVGPLDLGVGLCDWIYNCFVDFSLTEALFVLMHVEE